MKKIVPGTLIVFGQLMVALLFLVFLFSKADNKYQEVVVLENNNLNKTEDVISGLFVVNSLLQNKTEKDEELVDLIDATIQKKEDAVEETANNDNNVSYLADEFYLKYKTDEAMGFNVSVNNNTYDVSGSDLDLLIAVICVEAGDSIDDALAVISVILNIGAVNASAIITPIIINMLKKPITFLFIFFFFFDFFFLGALAFLV